jgi:alpha/beta hydrolase fold
MGMSVPETRYARSGDVMVAYQVLGEGQFDVIFAPGFVSHVELQWEAAGLAALLRGIATHARVIVFDKRGAGLSDRIAGVPTLEERSDDIRAVMDATGSERAALLGFSEGVWRPPRLAAGVPEQVMPRPQPQSEGQCLPLQGRHASYERRYQSPHNIDTRLMTRPSLGPSDRHQRRRRRWPILEWIPR